MTSPSDAQLLLEERLKTIQWQMTTTVVWGLLAAVLSSFGEASLERARPLFPMLDQNFGLWQNAYAVVLLALGLAWLAALMQKVNLLLDTRERMKVQAGIDEKKARQQREREERQAQRQQAAAEFEAAQADLFAVRRPRPSERSSKFDY